MSPGTLRRWSLAARAAPAILTLLLEAPAARASSGAGAPSAGPISLVITYSCRPESRPAFRDHLTGDVVGRLDAWRRAGALTEYLLLFSVDVNEGAWDALLLLRFESWGQYARWKDVERGHPAALTPEGLRLTSSVSSALSELAWEGRGAEAKRPPEPPVYFVRPYFFSDEALYRQFFEAYNSPQLRAWVHVGAVNSYRVLMNQNPTGGTWGALFLYEYPGWEAANARDAVKDAVGPELRKLPGWQLLGETKGSIRTSGRATLAERLAEASASR